MKAYGKVLLTWVLLIFALAGCGTKGPGETVRVFLEDMKAGNYSKAAQYISARTIAEKQTDPQTFIGWLAGKDDPGKIESIKILSERWKVIKPRFKFKLQSKDKKNP